MNVARYVDRKPVGDWSVRSACVGMDPDLFFPRVGSVPRAAREVCEACPVRRDCLDHALANYETAGVWGGTTHGQRVRIGYYRIPRLVDVSRCGTDSGYSRHRRNSEPACDECKAAHAAAHRSTKAPA